MPHEFTQPGRLPRVRPGNGMISALHVSVPVRLLGLNSDVLLLACTVPLRVGSTVRVVTDLAGRRLEVELCVNHVSNRPDEGVGGYVLAGRLPSRDRAAWRNIAALPGASATCAANEPAPRTAQSQPETLARADRRDQRPVRRQGCLRQELGAWIFPGQ